MQTNSENEREISEDSDVIDNNDKTFELKQNASKEHKDYCSVGYRAAKKGTKRRTEKREYWSEAKWDGYQQGYDSYLRLHPLSNKELLKRGILPKAQNSENEIVDGTHGISREKKIARKYDKRKSRHNPYEPEMDPYRKNPNFKIGYQAAYSGSKRKSEKPKGWNIDDFEAYNQGYSYRLRVQNLTDKNDKTKKESTNKLLDKKTKNSASIEENYLREAEKENEKNHNELLNDQNNFKWKTPEPSKKGIGNLAAYASFLHNLAQNSDYAMTQSSDQTKFNDEGCLFNDDFKV